MAAAQDGRLESCRWLRSHSCPYNKKVMSAAAAAGHLHILQWLWGPNSPLTKAALTEAARHGHVHVCEWLLSCGCPWSEEAPSAAAYGGHVDLMYDLLDEQPSDIDYNGLLVAAAAGCDLPTLQGLLHVVLEERRRNWQPPSYTQHRMLAAAYASATPDWRAKVEWLQQQGYEPADGAARLELDWKIIASGTDSLGRLELLRSRWGSGGGLCLNEEAAVAFAAAGNNDGLRLLYPDCREAAAAAESCDAVLAAADAGLLPTLQVLYELCAFAVGIVGLEHRAMVGAARKGHLHVVAWLATRPSGAMVLRNLISPPAAPVAPSVAHARLTEEVFAAAAESGSLELMAWLRQHGCAWGPGVFAAAAGAGSVAVLEWLAGQGCPMGDTGEPYVRAARNGDMATLRALRRLGCPWGPAGDGADGGAAIVGIGIPPAAGAARLLRSHNAGVVFRIIASGSLVASKPLVRWMLSEGCPVDWGAAIRAATSTRERAWLRQERRRVMQSASDKGGA